MAKSTKKITAPAKKAVTAAKRAVVKTVTEVRNTAIPKLTPAKRKGSFEITHDQIAQRAYEIHCSGNGGSDTDNWFRAERELRGI
ncbi:MAG TPA: DUF2934 domain-containing protein [Tepidisphaeraceae bacterium]|nr:DUF2934 domain-containing protein [Tepidisphaeraceae bacterium]